MAMRHPKATVLSGALTALVVMTVSYLFILIYFQAMSCFLLLIMLCLHGLAKILLAFEKVLRFVTYIQCY